MNATMFLVAGMVIVGSSGTAVAADKPKQDVVVLTPGPPPVKADTSTKPSVVGVPVREFKPHVKIKPAAPPPSPKSK